MEKPVSKIPTKALASNIPLPSKSRESQRARSKSVENPTLKMNNPNDHERYPQGQNVRFGFDSYGSQEQKPKYQRRSSLTRDSYTALHDNQSEFSKVFKRDHRQLPEFEKDFGPYGSTVLREVEQGNPDEDISTMFHRSDDVLRGQRPATVTANSWIRNEQVPIGYQNEKRGSTDVHSSQQSRLPSAIKRSTGYGYTAQDLDEILAKYKNKPASKPEQEFQVYQMTTSNKYENIDPDFTQGYPFDKHACNQVDKSIKPRNEDLGAYGKSFGPQQQLDDQFNLRDDNLKTKSYKSSKHTFPFLETADGKLVILPEQVAFESRKISVLVADPGQIGSIRTEKVLGVREQSHVLRQIEDVIHRSLSHGSNDANSNHSKYDVYGKAVPSAEQQHWKNAKSSDDNDDYSEKEIFTTNYSTANQGSGKLMIDLHQRIKSGTNADTHIMIGDKVYPCHSIALEVYSSFFDRLSRPRESIRKIQLPESEVPADIFPIFMDWIMQNDEGRETVINKINVVSLFSCAQYLDIVELKSQCINFLHEKVETNDRHLMQLWEEVKNRRNCQELMAVIASKAASSFQQIYKSRQFLNLDVDEIVMLLSSDDIVIESELDAYDTAIRWLLHQWSERKIHTNQIMSTVRFGLLTPLQLTQIAHCPDFSKGTNAQEYAQVLAYGSVKSMIDDGLAYSIVDESYKNQPDELKHWIESTGIRAPRPRTHLNFASRTMSFSYHKEPVQRGEFQTSISGSSVIERQPSYTIFRGGQPGQPGSSSKSVLLNNTVPDGVRVSRSRRSVAATLQDGILDNDLQSGLARSRSHSQPRSPSSDSQRKTSFDKHGSSDFSQSGYEKPYSATSSKISNLEHAAQMLGQPIKQEDIEHLTGSDNISTDKPKQTPTNHSWN